MKIDGTLLAKEILADLAQEVKKLKSKEITPHLAVIMIGSNSASLSYIKQKRKAALEIDAKISVHQFTRTPLYQKIAQFILNLDTDPTVHGIIIQRPTPPSLSAQILNKRVSIHKDIDGFLVKSPYTPPVGLNIFKIMSEIRYRRELETDKPKHDFNKPLISWLKGKKIVLLGRGDTAGKPIAHTLQHFRINFIHLNSKSESPEEYTKQADIIISAVGKKDALLAEHVKQDSIVIGVGMHKKGSKLMGDYNENEVAKVAKYYTTTPGGVGPVNVACLLQNLISSAKQHV